MGGKYFYRDKQGVYIVGVMGKLRVSPQDAKQRLEGLVERSAIFGGAPGNTCIDAITIEPSMVMQAVWLYPRPDNEPGAQDNITVISLSKKYSEKVLKQVEDLIGCEIEEPKTPFRRHAKNLLDNVIKAITTYRSIPVTRDIPVQKLFALYIYIGFRTRYEKVPQEIAFAQAMKRIKVPNVGDPRMQ